MGRTIEGKAFSAHGPRAPTMSAAISSRSTCARRFAAGAERLPAFPSAPEQILSADCCRHPAAVPPCLRTLNVATARARRISIYTENVATARAVGKYRYTSRLSMYIDAAEQGG